MVIYASVGDSFYQLFKRWFLDIVMVSADAFHIYFGIICLLAIFLLTKRRELSYWMLLPGFLISIAMECIDLYDIYMVLGEIWPEAALHDLFTTNLIPLLLVMIFKRAKEKDRYHPVLD